jgi:hypothetical protein
MITESMKIGVSLTVSRKEYQPIKVTHEESVLLTNGEKSSDAFDELSKTIKGRVEQMISDLDSSANKYESFLGGKKK